jgi:3-phosphoshikimate 1-carboxyvinyltransferase
MSVQGPLKLEPLPQPPRCVWRVPGSKSITNRALLLAALADGESLLSNYLESDDTQHMRTALQELGIGIEQVSPTELRVHGGRGRLRAPTRPLFVGNSGTTVRFLTALCCFVPGEVTLVGDEHMARRPIADLVEGLRQLGARIDCPTGCPPLTVHGGSLRAGTITMRGDRSSQYFSAVLLAGALAEGELRVVAQGSLVSAPYVEITRRMIEDFGGRVTTENGAFIVAPLGSYQARRYEVEPDASAASYPFALAAGSGGAIEVPGLARGALQGDYAFVDVLARAGACVAERDGATAVEGGTLHGVDVDMHHISDTVMTLAALAVLADGPTIIRNVENIRIKETDRLEATANELRRLGQAVRVTRDSIEISPRKVIPASIECYGDHRMAMSFAILGALVPGITISDPACVAKTYPRFWEDLAACYASVGATLIR